MTPLPRVHLFELEDLAWFPSTIRDLATDYLHYMESRFATHRPVVPLLRDALVQSGATHVVDLCSGGGGPALALHESLLDQGLRVRFTLTDKFPNHEAFAALAAKYPNGISYRREQVDAADVPREVRGFRTVFNAFHHFSPAMARRVLQSAVDARQPIGVFEIPERSLPMILPLLFTPAYVLLATPFVRPFLWRRLFFTYLVPLVPLTCWWDGLVSQLRAYTVEELRALTNGLGGGYEWQAGRVPIGHIPGNLTYLIGIPGAAE